MIVEDGEEDRLFRAARIRVEEEFAHGVIVVDLVGGIGAADG